jgi:radical SAM protein with 4Fe4S-binding SPASM domain
MGMNKLTTYRAPVAVNIEVTEHCNLRCFFCFCNTDEYVANLPQIPNSTKLHNLHRILEVLAEHEIFEVRWFGGEFALLPGWRDLVDHAYESNFFMSFVSNGTVLTKQDVSFLKSRGINHGTVSLHGPPEINDHVVQSQNAFKLATQTIDHMVDTGLNVAIAFTPNELNLTYFESFARMMIERHDVSSVGVNRLFRSKRYQRVRLSDYLFLMERIKTLQDEGLPVFFIDSIPLCKIPVKYWPYIGGCSQGVSFAQVDYMGNIKNCSSLSANLGNILEEDLEIIWRNRLREFRTLRHLPLSCRLCPTFCGGGCIASRRIDRNLVPDELITTPEEETLLDTLCSTARNYLNQWRQAGEVSAETAGLVDPKHIPNLDKRFRIRKEKADHFLCMVENKGLVTLNQRAYWLLTEIDNIKTSGQILESARTKHGACFSLAELTEVLSLFT